MGTDKKHAFAMITELFSPRSKGTVTLKSTDPSENPIIDCNYLSDPLDLLVLTEGCQLGNEIVLKGAGTKDVVAGSWPQGRCPSGIVTKLVLTIGQLPTIMRSPLVRSGSHTSNNMPQHATMLLAPAKWDPRAISFRCLMRSSVFVEFEV